ncbi:hypothetical protein [Novosphingobium sp. BL-52-GroH]|uniref:hypothetical protein n=1 Tax=Novosphingobium sp. BL-52-GroH TaxID=3349877 RepID=UPI00384AA0D4
MTPHHAFPDVTWADLRAELLREIAHRQNTFPRLVSKGQLTQADADRQLDLFGALLEDVRRFQASREPVDQGKPAINPLQVERRAKSTLHAYTWSERRAAITRELSYREQIYPRWISKGQLTQADADRQVRRLKCLRAIYELGLDWKPSNGVRPHFSAIEPTPQEQDSRDEWQAIEADIAAREGVAQEEMAL